MGRVASWRKKHRYWGGNSVRGNRPYHPKPVYRKDRVNYVAPRVPRAPNASERWSKRSVPRAPYRNEPYLGRPPNAAEWGNKRYLPRAPYKGE